MSAQTDRRSATEREELHREADRRWSRLAEEHPELADTIAFGRGLVDLYIDDLPGMATVALTVEAAREKLAQQLSLLEDEDIKFDLPGIRHFFFRLCSWAGQQPELAPGGDRLQRAMMAGELVIDDLLLSALAGDSDAVAAVAERFAVPPELVQTLTGFMVTAALIGAARALAPVIAEAGVTWEEGYCPVCGGPPLLAELNAETGERVLRCSACGIAWRYPRGRCAHCGTEDDEALRSLVKVGEEDRCRADCCDRCRGYVKTLFASAPTPPELLTIEDASMLHIDVAARERNYSATPTIPDEQ